MTQNKFRELLNRDQPTLGTRLLSSWATMTEALGATHQFDYVEFLAEYGPYTQYDLENLCRSAELQGMASIIKVDFANRFYTAQKALACGFQGVLFTDHKTAQEVEESIYYIRPDSPEYGGRFGFPNRRWIGYQPHLPQLEHAKMVSDVVVAVMIEKREALENIEEICSVPGVDMVQFGPSDFSLSNGYNAASHKEETKAAERQMIAAALRHGVRPRAEIQTAEEAKYYLDLGVRDFCLGDEMKIMNHFWTTQGEALRAQVYSALH